MPTNPLSGAAASGSSNNNNNNNNNIIPSEGGMNDLINQYPLRAFPTTGVVNPWVRDNVPAGPSLGATALAHHVDTHATRLSAALTAQGSAPDPRRLRLLRKLQRLRDSWPRAEWYPAAFAPNLPPPENVVTAMWSLTKLWQKGNRGLADLWVVHDDPARCGLLVQAFREKRAVRLTEEAAGRDVVEDTVRYLARRLGREAGVFGPHQRGAAGRRVRRHLEAALGVGRRGV
ncbi:hypothetical protein ColTof4_13547 [Colletotrichum tofieldiae]|nr:hypothetical protein ColTof3_14498 [Colletotrichum tofieldiae]GKT81124.1 hypothetical protein ColTof4_13547 [Colletotrichum tofieldiae]